MDGGGVPAGKIDAAQQLVIKHRSGELSAPDLVLKMLDTGGQPAFLQILELLTTPAGTVYVVVFSLAQLDANLDECAASTIAQLHSIQLHAAGALYGLH